MTLEEARAKARADFAAVVGTIIRPEWICGIVDFNSCEINNDGRIAARVLDTPDADVTRTCDDFVDPYWNLEIVEDPNGETLEIDHPWTWGTSYEFED